MTKSVFLQVHVTAGLIKMSSFPDPGAGSPFLSLDADDLGLRNVGLFQDIWFPVGELPDLLRTIR